MDYSLYRLGAVVKEQTITTNSSDYLYGKLGHIVGFDEVIYSSGTNTIIKVKWSDGQTTSIHPSNVEVL